MVGASPATAAYPSPRRRDVRPRAGDRAEDPLAARVREARGPERHCRRRAELSRRISRHAACDRADRDCPREGAQGAARSRTRLSRGLPFSGLSCSRRPVDQSGAPPRLGLCDHRALHRPARRRRRSQGRGDRRCIGRKVARAPRLGRAQGLGMGREPRARPVRARPAHRRTSRRGRGAVEIRQGGAGHDGVRPSVLARVHRLVRRGRGEAASAGFRGAAGEPHRIRRVSLVRAGIPPLRRAEDRQ